jgi:GNAT superfamily N-acetyltransferase
MGHSRNSADVLKGYPKEIILEDGTGVTLKPLEAGDETALFEMFKQFSADELWFLNHDVSDPRLIHDWVKDLDLTRVISIVASLGGRIIANAALMRKRYGAKSHIGKIRIAVDPSFREKRLGTWMLLDIVNLGIALGLKILVMRLVRDRDAYIISRVRNLDFFEEQELKNYVLDREGNPHDLIIMTKRLPVGWGDS